MPIKQDEPANIEKQIELCRNEIESFKKRNFNFYDDFRNGLINNTDYSDFTKINNQDSDIVEKKLIKSLEEKDNILNNNIFDSSWVEKFNAYKNTLVLSKTMVVSLIDRITVSENKEIKVSFKYEKEFNSTLEYICRVVESAGVDRRVFEKARYQFKYFPQLKDAFGYNENFLS